MPHPVTGLKADLELLCTTILQAGKIIRAAYQSFHHQVHNKPDGTPVTSLDIEISQFLRKSLLRARPNYGFLSEEDHNDPSSTTCPLYFLADPIDGTRAFIDRKPEFVVSIAIMKEHHPLIAALYHPLNDRLYTASLGYGAHLNGRPLKVADRFTIEGTHIIGYARKLAKAGFKDIHVTPINSMAYRMALISQGHAHATIAFTDKSDWDVAAADLIARESGLQVTDLHGQRLTYNSPHLRLKGIICAPPELHRKLSIHLQKQQAAFKQDPDMQTRTNERYTLLTSLDSKKKTYIRRP